jgi:hypothetical protein
MTVFIFTMIYRRAIFTIARSFAERFGFKNEFMKISTEDEEPDEYIENEYIKLTDI